MLQELRLLFLRWAILLSAVALLLGILNLLASHLHKVNTQEKGWPYSALLIIILLGTLVLGLVFGPDNRVVLSVFEYIQLPVEATLMALLAVSLAAAGVRMIARRRDVYSLIFIGRGAAGADGHGAVAVRRQRAVGDLRMAAQLAGTGVGGRRGTRHRTGRGAGRHHHRACVCCSGPIGPTGTEAWQTSVARCAASPTRPRPRNAVSAGRASSRCEPAVRRRSAIKACRPCRTGCRGCAARRKPPRRTRRRLRRPTAKATGWRACGPPIHSGRPASGTAGEAAAERRPPRPGRRRPRLAQPAARGLLRRSRAAPR